jgi:hypothetical protein
MYCLRVVGSGTRGSVNDVWAVNERTTSNMIHDRPILIDTWLDFRLITRQPIIFER